MAASLDSHGSRSRGTDAAARRAAERASLTTWIAVLAGMIGAFMAILNIQITNASLLDIEGGIGTGVDNGAWISTSYLIGEIVVIPLTDYLSRVFSFRRYMLANAILFALFSMACAFAHDLASMIAMRGLQGFAGGVLIPMAFTHGRDQAAEAAAADRPRDVRARRHLRARHRPDHRRLPHRELRLADHLLHQLAAEHRHDRRALAHARAQPMQLGLLKEGDWAGIVTMAIGLSALQTVLEEGNKDDWFGSPFIVRLAIIAAVFLTLFVVIELTVEKPLVNLRLLTQRNFGIGTLANVLVGFALFGSVYHAAAISRPGAGLQCRADRQRAGLDRPAAAAADPVGADADEALRRALHRVRSASLIFAASCFMNIDDVARQCRRSVLAARTSCAPSARRWC